MFHLDLPNVYKVLTNGEFKLDETIGESSIGAGGGEGGGKASESSKGGDGGGGGAGGEGIQDNKKQDSAEDDEKTIKIKERLRSKQIVVVSIFGNSFNQAVPKWQRSRYKRAFQLVMDAFGTVALYKEGKHASTEKGNKKGEESKNEKSSCSSSDSSTVPGATGEGAVGDESCRNERKENDDDDNGEGNGTGENNLTNHQVATGGTLEGFLNEDESVLFLHIEGIASDAAACMEACQELRSSMKDSGFLSVWSSFNSNYCKWLLILFSLSHVMILSETGGSFDTSYISLFRALDAVRLDVMSSVSKILSTIDGLPRQWMDHARLCSPRLIFLFEVETINPRKFQNSNLSTFSSPTPPSASKLTSTITTSVKERKDLLQNEIYQIFRKCRIITNISANSLFAVPATDDFVFIFDKAAQNTLADGSVTHSLSYTYLELISTAANQRKNQKTNILAGGVAPSRMSTSTTSLSLKTCFRSTHETLTYTDIVQSFQKFLLDHVALALDKGFDDDFRRVSGNKHFFVRPTLGQWEQVYRKLHRFLILEPSGSKRISDAYVQMDRFINVNAEHLEIQCAELFPKVFSAYQRSLPEFYTAQQHQQKLSYAVNLFLNISRGPGVIPWLKKLALKCEKHWKNGRQQCETLSLLGHVCSQPLHRLGRKDHLEIVPIPDDIDPELQELPHSSSSRLVSYCNCGRRQMSREEPFTIRQANYDFYRKAGRDCCDKLERYEFSVFTSSRDENVVGEQQQQQLSLQEMIVILQRKSESLSSVVGVGISEGGGGGGGKSIERNAREDQNERQAVVANGDLEEVFEAELRQEESDDDDEGLDLDDEEEDDAKNSQEGQMGVNDGKGESQKQGQSGAPLLSSSSRSLFKRNSSTVEYLPGMYHSKSPLGLLPLFPSWSLVCLGSSSIYSHSHGVSQHGFLSGANCLLPWDVKVKAEKGVMFVPPSRLLRERRTRHHRPRREILVSSHLPSTSSINPTGTNEFSVKVFFGFEYECRKGHRFFCDSHDKVLYALNISQVTQKTIAGKVIGTDMPLYVYCPCKENRDSKQIAQLLRVHVVTPKAPVFVTLAPKIQPGPGAPIFTPSPSSNEEDPTDAIKLTPSTYWILRVPFSYVGEVVYVPPTDISRYNGKLFKGIFNVISMNTEETEEWERQNQNRI